MVLGVDEANIGDAEWWTPTTEFYKMLLHLKKKKGVVDDSFAYSQPEKKA